MPSGHRQKKPHPTLPGQMHAISAGKESTLPLVLVLLAQLSLSVWHRKFVVIGAKLETLF